jgi:dTMP kinase
VTGLFISFEGIEGCGKSTQARRLAERFEAQGRRVLLTREPGGTPLAERIREIVLDPAVGELDTMAELLLFEAARAQHVAAVIRPALNDGAAVVCDRYIDSTTAYQGGGRGMDRALIERMHDIATGGLTPALTFWLDVPLDVGLRRAAARRASDRMEQEPEAFHERVREAFADLAVRYAKRIVRVDGTLTEEAIAERIWMAVEQHPAQTGTPAS